jgi:glucosamine--fructose-6-phosphate aminotransferase (isomerizing)
VTSAVIEGPYLADLLEQPLALERTWHQLDTIRPIAAKRIVLTGMGSSQHALYPLYLRLVSHGLTAHVVETAELLHYQSTLLGDGTLLVTVSQSGRSAEIISLMRRCAPDLPVIGVTNDDTSPLAARANQRLLLGAGPESTVSCKTYLSTLLMLEWLGASLTGGDTSLVRHQLGGAAQAVRSYLADWRTHVAQIATLLDGVERIFVTGRGPSLATAHTGGLILKESTRFAAEGMSCPAFRHGPFESVGPHILVLVCEGDARTAALNRGLAGDIAAAGGRVAILGPSATLPAFRWPEVSSPLQQIMEMLPVQMLTLALAARLGREAGRFEKATKITDVE